MLVLALLPVVLLDTARWQSLTCDEVFRIAAAVADVERGRVVLGREHPPLAALAAGASLRLAGVREGGARVFAPADEHVPDESAEARYGEAVVFAANPEVRVPFASRGPGSVLLAARAPTVLLAWLAALGVFLWARERHGPRGGLASLLLAATYSDLLGHGALVSYDVALAAATVWLGLALDRVARGRGLRWVVALGLLAGVTLAVKFSGAFAVLGSLLVALALLVRPLDPARASLAHPLGSGSARARAGAFARAFALVAGLAYLVLAAAYLGAEPIGAMREGLAVLRSYHVPPFDGILFGHARGPWWHYFLVASALKAPLGTLALLGIAAVLLVRRRDGVARELLVLGTPAVLFFAVSLTSRPLGSRYVLPAALGAFVAAGRVASGAGASRARAALVVLCLGWNVVAVAREHPWHQSATNVLAGPTVRVFEELDDSNQDWGGGLAALARWQRERGVERLAVLPFASRPFVIARGGSRPFLLYPADSTFFPWTAHLDAWGVRGALARADCVFAPKPGEVYAVSAHVLAWGRHVADEWKLIAETCHEPAPPLVLGGTLEASEVVGGGFLIFDLRDRRP